MYNLRRSPKEGQGNNLRRSSVAVAPAVGGVAAAALVVVPAKAISMSGTTPKTNFSERESRRNFFMVESVF